MRTTVEILSGLGLTANYTGFHYIVCSIKLLLEEPERLQCVTKQVYPDVAKIFRTSTEGVEAGIRKAAKIAWQKNPVMINKMAGYILTKQPTNAELLAIITTFIVFSDLKSPKCDTM